MKYTESETIELKSVYVEDIRKEIVAFANTCGGTIYVGVEDDGTICGVADSDYVIRQISGSARDAIKPDVTMFISYDTIDYDGRHIVEVKVQCGTNRPYYIGSKGLRPEGVYVRQGTSSVPASDLMIRRMIMDTDGDNYEDMRCVNQELTFEKACAEFVRRNVLFGETQMRSLGLTDGSGQYTNLALLLSDQCPHIIKAATFGGRNGEEFLDRMECGGSLLKQLEDAYNYLELRNSNAATYEGLLRIDHKSYPDIAIREALLNAIVHRDYGIFAPTLISVYDDRIEILSVGGLAGISYDDMMLGVSHCRNRKLAEIFYRLQLIESYGTGIKKIMNSYSERITGPEIQVTSGAYKIMLPKAGLQQLRAPEPVYICLDRNEKALLDLIKEKHEITRGEVEMALGVSASTAYRMLQRLAEAGCVRPMGRGRNVTYLEVAMQHCKP